MGWAAAPAWSSYTKGPIVPAIDEENPHAAFTTTKTLNFSFLALHQRLTGNVGAFTAVALTIKLWVEGRLARRNSDQGPCLQQMLRFSRSHQAPGMLYRFPKTRRIPHVG